MSRIYLARHGETEWNALGRLQGHTDVPLNEVGRTQASELATRLANEGIQGVTTSDLRRARETGAIIAEALGVVDPLVDRELRERRFGIFEGLTREECATQHPAAWKAWVEQTDPPEGAEPVRDAITRMMRAIARASERASTGPLLVVSHGGLMRLWLQDALGTTLPLIKNGAVYLVETDTRREVSEPSSALRVSRWGA